MILCIDPGHGGHDPGVVCNDIVEKEITLKVGLLLREHLHKGFDWPIDSVHMTRETDEGLSLRERGEKSKECKADLVLSIHVNSAVAEARGAIAFYWPGNHDGEKCAHTIIDNIPQELQRPAHQRSVIEATDQEEWLSRVRNVLKVHAATAVLLESAFCTNKENAFWLKNPDNLVVLAGNIAQALEVFKGQASPSLIASRFQ